MSELEIEPQKLLAGNVWDTTRELSKLHNLSTLVLHKVEAKETRLPFWNDYYIFPIYHVYAPATSQDEVDFITSVEDKDFLTKEEWLEFKEGRPVVILKGIIGVHRTSGAIVHTRDLMPSRYLFNAQNFAFDEPDLIICKTPMEVMILLQSDEFECFPNIVATMHDTIMPAQEMWILRYAKGRVATVNLQVEEETLRPPGANFTVQHHEIRLDSSLSKHNLKALHYLL